MFPERRENSRMLLMQSRDALLQRRIAPVPRCLGDLVRNAEIAVEEVDERGVWVDLDERWTGPNWLRWSSENGHPVKPHRPVGRFSRIHPDSGSPGTNAGAGCCRTS